MKMLFSVLAGGNGTRIHPLSIEDSKPTLPFAAGYRIVDFVLGNLVNSGITSIHVLMQCNTQSLIEYLRAIGAPRPGKMGPGSPRCLRRPMMCRPRSEARPTPSMGTCV